MSLLDWRDDTYYRIDGYERLEPFFTSVMSACDLWLFASSRGGLTAGRRDPGHSIFPYETVDRLHVAHPHTGPVTAIRCKTGEGMATWQPFAEGEGAHGIERSLYKHVLGCELWFEERNIPLGFVFRYGWRPSEALGWVRTSELVNEGDASRQIEILDGVRNVLPAGVEKRLQDTASCLVDAYKMAESDPTTTLAIFRLSANIIDRAEASEALWCTTAWQMGLPDPSISLDARSVDTFLRHGDMNRDSHFNGRRSSYLAAAKASIGPGETRAWHIVLDTPVDQAGVVARKNIIARGHDEIEDSLAAERSALRRLLSASDAFQCTGDSISTAHHTANVLYNIARGGVLPDQYRVDAGDFASFLETRNRVVADRHRNRVATLPDKITLDGLLAHARETNDVDLIRLCTEYLPIVFSRRHGDPSRPWNQFSIVMRNPDGSPRYAYQGNWRDIFQNWEALCRSFPECLEPIISKFVNASTVDGFNPYRITSDGIDWEIADPDDPWSSIGYWGDHQIVYLTKLLETSRAHHPDRLRAMLADEHFSCADVPYDIVPFADIVADPRNTIRFSPDRQRATEERVRAEGTDGRLVHDGDHVLYVSFAEKLLIPILAKLSNLVPGGGIWMNTMRPEWNDANNALVGNGLSVVTTCYLHRHLDFCTGLFAGSGLSTVPVSEGVVAWLGAVADAIGTHIGDSGEDRARRVFLDTVGEAFSTYRSRAYAAGPGRKTDVATAKIVDFLTTARRLAGETIAANRRPDGLYHAYNLLHLSDGTASISHLPLMLEGQVAALSSGIISPENAAGLLGALRKSALYRDDQRSYLLYPERELPEFLDENRVPEEILDRSPTLAAMVQRGDTSVVARDANGQIRFNPECRNADALRARLSAGFGEGEAEAILDVYEQVFDHRSFTGRSGTMFGYEGIGCIYWHMVAKLLLAVQEVYQTGAESGASAEITERLRDHYDEIRGGLGFTKTPEEFGAWPLDPYSHTPGFGGAKQPGMTGQVKEEILTRFGELGVVVEEGAIRFTPDLLRDSEFLPSSATFSFLNSDGVDEAISLDPGSLAFTLCQVPVIYQRGEANHIVVYHSDGSEERIEGPELPARVAREVFARSGEVARIVVHSPTETA